MTNRYFADGISSVTASEDKTIVSLTFANVPKGGKKGAKPVEAFEVVLPAAGFAAMAEFFENLRAKLGLADDKASTASK